MNRHEIANYIIKKIINESDGIITAYQNSENDIGFFYIDNLLPEELVIQIYKAFPAPSEMTLKKSMREYKYVSAQMNDYNPILEEIIYAFQDLRVVALISKICHCVNLFPDEKLYAGGISLMGKDHFLNPHLDNSHNKDRNLWRVFNLLFYVSPNWNFQNGGHLELWPYGLEKNPILIESKFNRLVLMATHNKSIHSVTKVNSDNARCCISNYYFSEKPLLETDTFHVTSFRGRPENKITDIFLQFDTFFRMNIRKVFNKGIKENPHYYKKE